MFPTSRTNSLAGLALIALAGCSAIRHAQAPCTSCVSDVIVSPPSTYENYTPPQPLLNPIPLPSTEPAPAQDAPPPPETRNVPDRNFDFFDAAENEDLKTFNR